MINQWRAIVLKYITSFPVTQPTVVGCTQTMVVCTQTMVGCTDNGGLYRQWWVVLTPSFNAKGHDVGLRKSALGKHGRLLTVHSHT